MRGKYRTNGLKRMGLRASALVLVIALLVGAAVIYMFERVEYVSARMRAQYAMESLGDTIQYKAETALGKTGAPQADVDIAMLLASDRLTILEADGYAFELLKIDPLSGERRVLLESNGPIKGQDSLEMPLQIGDVVWTLRIAPRGGWISSSTLALSVALLLTITLLMAVFAYLIAHRHEGNLHKGAAIDELTGLYTRAAGEKLMRNAIYERAYERMALALLDVDDFSALKERCGLAACEQMLSSASFALRQIVRGQDIVCRVMSDMFMVGLLFSEDASFLEGRLEALRKSFECTIHTGEGETMRVHASAGVALLPENGGTFRELYEKADMALYWSKRGGKNQATFYRESQEGAQDMLA